MLINWTANGEVVINWARPQSMEIISIVILYTINEYSGRETIPSNTTSWTLRVSRNTGYSYLFSIAAGVAVNGSLYTGTFTTFSGMYSAHKNYI